MFLGVSDSLGPLVCGQYREGALQAGLLDLLGQGFVQRHFPRGLNMERHFPGKVKTERHFHGRLTVGEGGQDGQWLSSSQARVREELTRLATIAQETR